MVAVFTHHGGPLSDQFQARTGIRVFTPEDRQEVEGWHPDVLHVHHWTTLAYLRSAGVTAPAVAGFLGVLPDLENPPPPDGDAAIPWWSVSEEVRDNVARDPGWAAMPNVIIRNWFDDHMTRPTIQHSRAIRSVLVVSNHFPPREMELLVEASKARRIEVRHCGLPDNPRTIDPGLIAAHDAVVSLGRTAILAMALGKPALVLDQNGADGWVTASSVAGLAACNFSGRAHRLAVAEGMIGAWLDSPPTLPDLRSVQEWAWVNCRLTSAVTRLEELYARACASPDSGQAKPWHRVVGGYIQHSANLESHVEELSVAVESLREERDALRRARAQIDSALAESERARTDQQALVDGVLGSASWRATAPLRAAAAVARRAQAELTSAADSTRATDGHEPGPRRGYASESLAVHSAAAFLEFRAQERALPPFIPSRGGVRTTTRASASIPTMAWLAELEGDDWTFTLGTTVEPLRDGFHEGVWAGDFSRSDSASAEFRFGSGASLRRDRPVFLPPRHPKDALYVLGDSATGASWVSNSLAFVLEAGQVDPRSHFFRQVAGRMKAYTIEEQDRGVDRARPLVAQQDGLVLSRVVHHNFEVGRAGTLRRHWTRPRRHFSTYEDYRGLLLEVLGAAIANGTDPRRRHPLRPMTAVSTGYDSTAVTALARQLGVQDAVTLDVVVYGRADSGRAIAETLGLAVTEHPHLMTANISDLNLADLPPAWGPSAWEFFATPGLGDDINHLAFESKLANTIFLSGTYGDTTWAREPSPTSGLSCGPWGASLGEYRLRIGFAWVPVPIIGARFAPDLVRVGASEDMRPYTLGTDYDRPIPRRIAEQAGIPRDMFGVAKTATAPFVATHSDLLPEALEAVRARYRDWRD